MKRKLSKQSIFTILGILVIVASIPMAVLLVKQRQEIRKEAADQSCGSIGGNACESTSPDYTGNCRNLGDTYDCKPCYSCDPSVTCGNWCQSQVGHAGGSWCKCNSTPDSGYTLASCTSSGISDCSTCCAFTQNPGGGDVTCGNWCQSQVGHAGTPFCKTDANPDPGYTLKGCTSSGISDASYCCAFTQSSGKSCGSIGGNACESTSPDYTGNCRNLGDTYDCKPCYSCDPATPSPVNNVGTWGLYFTHNDCSTPPPPTPTTPPPPTPTPTGTPTYTTQCEFCRVYDAEWNLITDPSTLAIGQAVYFATRGSTTHSQGITKARFRFTVNGIVGPWQETTNKRGNELYIQYTIPATGSYQVESMVYNPSLGWY